MGGTAFSHHGLMKGQNGYAVTTVRGRIHEEFAKVLSAQALFGYGIPLPVSNIVTVPGNMRDHPW